MAMTQRRRAAARINLWIMGALALAAWVLVTLLATRPGFKLLFDLSPQAQFSLTGETLDLIEELRARDQVLEIDTFFQRVPRGASTAAERHFNAIRRRVIELSDDLLDQYAYHGGDNVRIQRHDLYAQPGATRERSAELGLDNAVINGSPVVVSIGKRRKFLSLEFDLSDIELPDAGGQGALARQAAMPVLKFYKGEEAIQSAARSLLVTGIPKLYLLDGVGSPSVSDPTGDSYSEFLSSLEDDGFEFEILNLAKTAEVPDDADGLVILEPKYEPLAEHQDALYRYLRRGGRVLLNLSFTAIPADHNPSFDVLGERLGFRVGSELLCHLTPQGNGGPGTEALQIQGMSPVHPITRPLLRAQRYPFFRTAREVRAREGGPVEHARLDLNLLRTGEMGFLTRRLPGGYPDFNYLPPNREDYRSRSAGAVVTVQPEGGERSGELVIFSGKAFLNAGGWKTNGDLGLNTVNWMVERNELVTVRGNRYRSTRLEPQPYQIQRIQWLLILAVPGVLLLGAFAARWLRRRGA